MDTTTEYACIQTHARLETSTLMASKKTSNMFGCMFFCNAILFAQSNHNLNHHRFNSALWENLANWNLKLLAIYAIEKTKNRLGNFVRNILLTLNPEITSFSSITLSLARSFIKNYLFFHCKFIDWSYRSKAWFTSHDLGLTAGLMVAYIPCKRPEANILNLTWTWSSKRTCKEVICYKTVKS